MNTINKKIIALLALVALILPALVPRSLAGATVKEPQLTVQGTVTKDIIDMNNIFLYTDENSKNQSLPYGCDGNISFSVYNVYFRDGLVNTSVAKAGTLLTSTFTINSKQFLYDANKIPYILIDETYSTTGNTAAQYGYITFSMDLSTNPYLLIIAKILDIPQNTAANLTSIRIQIVLVAVDEGGEDHYIVIQLGNVTAANAVIDVVEDSDTLNDDYRYTIGDYNFIKGHIYV
ncbi:MAG: hypothetical protein DSY42_07860, partial [Aquifex sp.]